MNYKQFQKALFVGFLVLADLLIVIYHFQNNFPTNNLPSILNENPKIFLDDRDLWLSAAYGIVKNNGIGEQAWQINFWPPGQVGLITLLMFIFQSYKGIIIGHTALSLILLSTIYYSILSEFWENRNKRFFAIFILAFWNFSFMNLSPLMKLVLCPDYISALFFALGIWRLLLLNKAVEKSSLFRFITIVSLVCSAYIRIAFYQSLIMLTFLSIFIYIKKKQKDKTNSIGARDVSITLMIVCLSFIPWILIRSWFGQMPLSTAIQFSDQGRYAMSVQWWDNEYMKDNNVQYIGAGTACKLDPVKCKFFSLRDKKISEGEVEISWGKDADEKTKAALLVFAKNPIKVGEIKFPVILNGYFQRSAYSSIDGSRHLRWDLLFYLTLLFSCIFIAMINAKTKTLEFSIVVIGIFNFVQLFFTQVEFRFFYPVFVMLSVPTMHIICSDKNFMRLLSKFRKVKIS